MESITLDQPITNETEFVDWVESMIELEGNLLGHREDAIAVNIGDTTMVINIDGWVESSDRPEGMTSIQAGYRAVANAISDVIVKGARPVGMIISSSLGARHQSELKDLIRGFNMASRDFGVPYFGGDMNSGNDLVIDVTVWGISKRLIRRDGAKPGDGVYWMGPALGSTAAALGILKKQWLGSKERALEIMGKPGLYPEFLNLEANSATDSSDGLAKSLYLIADASDVKIQLDRNNFNTASWIDEVARRNRVDLVDLFFYGGEELGIVFTHPINEKPIQMKNCIKLGEVQPGEGVFLDNMRINNRGWDHFSNL